jgi:hypothetical protein
VFPKIMEIPIRQNTFHCERENTQITNHLTLKCELIINKNICPNCRRY